MKQWAEEVLAQVAAVGKGHLKATFGEVGCFSEKWSWIDIRWEGQVAFVRGEHEDTAFARPILLQPTEARAVASAMVEAGAIEEPDVGRSTTGAIVRFEGEYAPLRGQSVSFLIESRASLVDEPSRRLAALENILRSLADR